MSSKSAENSEFATSLKVERPDIVTWDLLARGWKLYYKLSFADTSRLADKCNPYLTARLDTFAPKRAKK